MVLRILTSSKLKPLIFFSLVSLLSSCAQSPQRDSSVSDTNDAQQQTREADAGISARELYKNAAQYKAEAQQYHLLKAARQALKEEDYLLALAITENLKNSPYPAIRQQNVLPLLQAYLTSNQQHTIDRLLNTTNLSDIAKTDQAEYLWLGGHYQSQRQRYLPAVRLLLQLESQPQAASQFPEFRELLWQNLTALTDNQLQELRTNAPQTTLAWINLAQLSRRYVGQPELLAQAMSDWHRKHPTMPDPESLPVAVQQLNRLQPYKPQKVAVLLPLNGQFRQHAQAIQYGLLAAASRANEGQLIFINSQQPVADIQNQLQAQQVEFVIGPLLKDQVDEFSRQTDWPWPTLFLNSKDAQTKANAGRFYYALSMEDEAAQTARLFEQKNYRHPVVINVNNDVSRRMQQHFSSQWQQMGYPAPEHHQFNSKEDLESLIARLLETDRSKERVKQISSLTKEKLNTDTHSRLDIDAIYLIADPVQTRLFKPFVDVSVSESAPRLPIYASSRSHSTGLSQTDLRDLNGLTFTEMPWMLGGIGSADLREQYKKLFPDQDETLQRLFAMGYDAYRLISSLKQQQQITSMVFPGLTGQLRLSADGSIVRQLSWASYRNGRLIPVQEP